MTPPPRGRIDPTTVDWSRVARAAFQVRHHYRYTYGAPATQLHQRLVMIPPDRHGDQRLLTHTLRVSGAEGQHAVVWEHDRFGNRVAHVRAARVPEAVEFDVTYSVERVAAARRTGDVALPGAPAIAALPAAGATDAARFGREDLTQYLEPTALTAPDAQLRSVAAELAGELRAGAHPAYRRALAERAHDWASRALTYQIGITGSQTPAAMALHLGKGVCQDFAHIMLCVLRLMGVPGRYVSGHLLGEGVPHAWLEALIEDEAFPGGLEVIAYDPTHHARTTLQYVTVAVGRDFADVSPTSGTFTGVPGAMTWGKQATVMEVE